MENLNNYGSLYLDYDLKNNNTYGISSICKYYLEVKDKESLKKLIEVLNSNNIKYFILGGGSNIILKDDYYDGVIISLKNINSIIIDNNKIYAEAGCKLAEFVLSCVNNDLSGYENISLIPGSLGGALYGNAGCNNTSIYDNLVSIEVLRDNKFINIKKDDIKINYRYSMFKDNSDIIISAKFKLKKGNKEEMLDIIKDARVKRMASQPLEYHNAGSVFKNPKDNYAGKLIADLNLKGYHINDAEVSIKHANFIINKNNASGDDILKLIDYIKKEVKKNYNIDLELEQIIVSWK